MTDQDRQKWNARYRENLGSDQPSRILEDFYDLSLPGKALDIACGNGRNSLFLAGKGFQVDAVDISPVALDPLAGQNPGINVICQDMDTWKILPDAYQVIVNIHFLDRRLFPLILSGLKPGGVLIFESFVDEKKEKFCLKPNELIHAFQSLRIVYYQEKELDPSARFRQMVSLVAVKTP